MNDIEQIEQNTEVVDPVVNEATEDKQEQDNSESATDTHTIVKQALNDAKKEFNIKESSDQNEKSGDTKTLEDEDLENKTEQENKPKLTVDQAEKEALIKKYGEQEVDRSPRFWKKEAKEAWDKVPLAVKYQIREYENSQNSFIEKQRAALKKHESIVEEYDTLKAEAKTQAKLQGKNVSEYYKTLVAADKVASKDPLGYLVNFANNYKIDLRKLVSGQQAFDRNFHKERFANQESQTELQELREELRAIREEREKAQSEQEIQPFLQIANNFLASKPKDEVSLIQDDIAYNVQRVMSEGIYTDPHDILDEAYTRALRANPEGYELYKSKQSKKAAEKARAELAAKQRARGVQTSNAGYNTTHKSHANIRDAVAEAMQEIKRR